MGNVAPGAAPGAPSYHTTTTPHHLLVLFIIAERQQVALDLLFGLLRLQFNR